MEKKYLIVFVVMILMLGSISLYFLSDDMDKDLQTEDTEFPQRTVDTGEEHVLTFDGERVDAEELVMDSGGKIIFINEDPSSHFIEITNVTGRTVMPESETILHVDEIGEHTLYISDIDSITLIVE